LANLKVVDGDPRIGWKVL